jgi:uncharacterized Zn finger protein
MSYYYRNWYKQTTPKSVKGGIKTGSGKRSIAENWWGKKWIATLESFHLGARLNRGKAYAKKGQVMSLDVQKGEVIAKVQGSSSRPYKVNIRFRRYNEAQWEKIIARFSENPIECAQLVNGTMPEDIEASFSALGLPLFPQKRDDLETDCSCPDWSNPCKHIAAVFYLLAEAFDKNPFLLFELRGKNQTEILEKLQTSGLNSEENYTEIPDEPLPVNAIEFWGKEQDYVYFAARNVTMHAAIPKRLGLISFWRSEKDLQQELEKIYKTASQKAMQLKEKKMEARENG